MTQTIEQLTARVRELEEELERKMSAGQYVLEQLSAAQEEIGGWKKDQKENMDIIFKQQGEINELRAQLSAAQEEIVFASKDSLRLLETVKYLRGIAERGEVREQSEDETVEQFVLGYVKKLEDQLAKAEQRVAEAIHDMTDEVCAQLQTDDKSINYWHGVGAAAVAIENAIVAFEWRKFVKEV